MMLSVNFFVYWVEKYQFCRGYGILIIKNVYTVYRMCVYGKYTD